MRTAYVIGGGVLVAVLLLIAQAAGRRILESEVEPASAIPPEVRSTAAAKVHESFLYGRVTTVAGVLYEGWLRWGGNEEALWGHYFNGYKAKNPWLDLVPPEVIMERRSINLFGVEVAQRERPIDLGRFFMARFGDIARLEASRDDVRVTLKSGTVFELDRFAAGDFDDRLRVWDSRRGTVDLDSRQIRSIELLPAPLSSAVANLLHGTVRTRQGDFSGLVQWDREACLGSDAIEGLATDGTVRLRFDTLRSIARHAQASVLLTLLDGRQIVLSGPRGRANRGLYVDDSRYGRVLIAWDVFERVDFSAARRSPAYGDFPPGHPLTGRVTTRSGRRLTGRLVYDLDESETTETLDAPSGGVDYTIPFGLVAKIALPGLHESVQQAKVTLHSGETLELESEGDLGEGNAGLLIFVDGRKRPEFVPWVEVGQVDFDRPLAVAPPITPSAPTAP
ncbi:MAG: hypothetical protein AAF657_15950 [Acidobacteriota bacterium]